MPGFRVDTHLFRELGALLVGRDSTALAELIKNSYDADATEVWVQGTHLGDPTRSRITLVDDGNGMTPDEFRRGFLTIAARSKSGPVRYSPIYQRRFTGAKGIGRLAAHKLAHVIEVVSVPRELPGTSGRALMAVRGVLDWDRIEERETLDDLEDVIVVEQLPLAASIESRVPNRSAAPDANRTAGSRITSDSVSPHVSRDRAGRGASGWQSSGHQGTTVILDRLRKRWTERDLTRFVNEVQSYEPPASLFEPEAPGLVPAPLLPRGLVVRSGLAAQSQRQSFQVVLDGDFDRGESLDSSGAASAHYVLEIFSDETDISYGIARTKRGSSRLKDSSSLRDVPIAIVPRPPECPKFQARILLRIGSQWPEAIQGIRVYMEGFRVLPYGEIGNDWLSLDDTYTKRSRSLVLLDYDDAKIFGTKLPDEGLQVLRNSAYLGAIFLREDSGSGLEMLVNREGFVPTDSYYSLVRAVNRGVGFLTRIRQADNEVLRSTGKPAVTAVTRERGQAVAERVSSLETLTSRIREYADRGDVAQATEALNEIVSITKEVSNTTNELVQEINMLRVLASVGTQLTAFVHELNGLLAVAQAAQKALADARPQMDNRGRRATAQLSQTLEELRRGLERQASYLVDITSADARRRRSAQRLKERIEAVFRVLARSALLRAVELEIDVDPNLRTRPMFRAELTAILTNLLTNAIKAASQVELTDTQVRRVRASAEPVAGGICLRVQNTGVRVKLEESEDWFKPYATSSVEIDPILGQGMGLGLPITRALVEENAGTVEFTQPDAQYATAIQVFLPAKNRRI